jgi:hypothetical protein
VSANAEEKGEMAQGEPAEVEVHKQMQNTTSCFCFSLFMFF